VRPRKMKVFVGDAANAFVDAGANI
jgi:hypothetical protein